VPLDINRDAAHQAAQNELAKPIYPKASLTDQLREWIDELLYRLVLKASSIPGGWFTITVLFIVLAVAVVAGVRIARHTMRTNRGSDYGLFGTSELSAAQHRAAAEQCAAVGDWAAAIRHRLRAIARQLEEDAVLTAVPGRTATELARDAGQSIPDLAPDLLRAATAFNDVSYGRQPGTEANYRMIADLDEQLRSTQFAPAAVSTPVGVLDRWMEVQ
jgi:hypothetical protein